MTGTILIILTCLVILFWMKSANDKIVINYEEKENE